MADKVLPDTICDDSCRESVSIHTRKIYDSCRDKDCIEDLRLYPTVKTQSAIQNAVSVRAKSAKLLYASVDVDEIAFNRGYFTVDVRFFYKITGEAFSLSAPPVKIEGLAIFDKRAILFGSESRAKVFTSSASSSVLSGNYLRRSNMPKAIVEAVDPIVLSMRYSDPSECTLAQDAPVAANVPEFVSDSFDGDLILDSPGRRLYISLGQFSIIRLERDSQMLVPVIEYCMPEKECATNEDDPCSLFSRIHFPIDEFFPPDEIDGCDCYRDALQNSCDCE